MLIWLVALLNGFTMCNNRHTAEANIEDESCKRLSRIDVPILYQDSKSTIHIAKSGHGNFKNTKHIKVRYYYISDLIRNNELIVKWIPSDRMIADILTKGVAYSVFCVL